MAVILTIRGKAELSDFDRAIAKAQRLRDEALRAGTGIQAGMARASYALGRVGPQISATGQALTRNLTLPLVAAGYAITRFTQAAAEDSKQQTVLATTLRNTAGATDATIASTEKWITAQQKALGVTDDQLRPALGILASATKDVTKAQTLASLALDISAARGIDAETASKALAKAYTGNYASLSRLVPGISKATIQSGKFRKVQAELATMVGGTASKAADTQAGKMERARVAMQEATEQLGYAFLPVMEQVTTLLTTRVVPAIERVASWFSKLSPGMRNAILAAAGVAAALGPVLVVVGTLTSSLGSVLGVLSKMPAAWMGALGPIGIAIGVIAALLASSPALREMLGNFLQGALKALAPLWDTVVQAMRPVMAALNQLVRAVLPPLIAIFKAVLPPVFTVVTAIIKALVPVIGVVIKIIGSWISIWLRVLTVVAQVVGSVISWVAKLAGAIGKWIAGIIGWFAKLAGRILSALGNAGQWLTDVGRRIVDGLLNGIKNAWNTLTGWLGNAVDNVVNSVKNALGISSPSRVFMGIGDNIGKGLQLGLERTVGSVARAAAGVAAAATVSANVTAGLGINATADAFRSPVPATSTSSSSVTIGPGAIVINIGGNADGAKVAGSVDKALRQLLREVRSL